MQDEKNTGICVRILKKLSIYKPASTDVLMKLNKVAYIEVDII